MSSHSELDYKQTWSLAVAAQIAWVLVAFSTHISRTCAGQLLRLTLVLTVIDSLVNIPDKVESNGQGVGSVFLWLLPIGVHGVSYSKHH